MVVTVASHKGGACKTTTAMHIAAFLQQDAPTLLLDGDRTRNALEWAESGPGLPFTVAPYTQAVKLMPHFSRGHVVLDTGQQLEGRDLREAVAGCDRLVIPTVPGSLDTRALVQIIKEIRQLDAVAKFRVLLARVPSMERDAQVLREALEAQSVPMFSAEIPRLKAFERAAAEGSLVQEVDDRNAWRAWRAYEAAGEELLASWLS